MEKVDLFNIGTVGVNKDIPPHYLPPEVWSNAKNIRFQDNVAYKFKGGSSVFGTPTVAPGFLMGVTTLDEIFWVYTSLTKAYVYESGTHTNITRQSAMVDVNYTTANYRDWNGGVLGGILLLNNGADIPQVWLTLASSTKLTNLVNWPSTLRAKIVRPFGQFLVALNINDNSTLYPHMFWWSHPAEVGAVPASWDYSDPAYDAGRKELTDVDGGELVDALMLRNLLIMYKETSTHYLRYIGGQEVMENNLLWAGSGILAPRCVASIDLGKRHFVATADDLIWHNGQEIESVVDKKLRKTLQNDIDSTNYINSFCVDNAAQREAWFCYPASGAEYPNKALVWNYKYNTLQFRDFFGSYATSGAADLVQSSAWSALSNTWAEASTAWTEEGRKQLLACDPVNTKIYHVDNGETFDGSLMTCVLERTGLAVDGMDRNRQPKVDYSSRKLVTRIWLKVVGTALLSVRLGAQDNFNDEVIWASAKSFDPMTDEYLDFIVNGRLIAVRIETTTDQPFQLEGYTLELVKVSEF